MQRTKQQTIAAMKQSRLPGESPKLDLSLRTMAGRMNKCSLLVLLALLLTSCVARASTIDCRQSGVSNLDLIQETEVNDTRALANALGTHAGFCGSINPIGDLDYFSFTLQATSDIYVSSTEYLDLALFNPSGSLVATSLNSTGISLLGQVTGTYFLRLSAPGNNSSVPSYAVAISYVTPGSAAPASLPFQGIAVTPEPPPGALTAIGVAVVTLARRRRIV